MQQFALAADDHDSAVFVDFLVLGEFFRLRGQETAVVPRQTDGRHFAACREFEEGLRGVRERNFVKRSANGFDAGGQAEFERPERDVEKMRAHVANRAAAPVDPAAPIKRMIDRMVGNFGAHAEEKIPRQRIGNGIAAREGCSESFIYAIAVPLEAVGGNAERFRARNALRPEAEWTICPDVNFADFADGAGLNIFDGETCFVGRVALIAHLRGDLGLFGFLGKSARFRDRPR